jgi:hypothetical protein
MVFRTDHIDAISSYGTEIVSNQHTADLFAASPHKSAPISPMNGVFVIGNESIVGTIKNTCPAPRAPTLELDKTFNMSALLPDVPDASTITFNPKIGK